MSLTAPTGIQGAGNMPAYGKNLAPDKVNALVAFLPTSTESGARAGRRHAATGRAPGLTPPSPL
jgi:hypothetical protein